MEQGDWNIFIIVFAVPLAAAVIGMIWKKLRK